MSSRQPELVVMSKHRIKNITILFLSKNSKNKNQQILLFEDAKSQKLKRLMGNNYCKEFSTVIFDGFGIPKKQQLTKYSTQIPCSYVPNLIRTLPNDQARRQGGEGIGGLCPPSLPQTWENSFEVLPPSKELSLINFS